jgi:hypothetical protein
VLASNEEAQTRKPKQGVLKPVDVAVHERLKAPAPDSCEAASSPHPEFLSRRALRWTEEFGIRLEDTCCNDKFQDTIAFLTMFRPRLVMLSFNPWESLICMTLTSSTVSMHDSRDGFVREPGQNLMKYCAVAICKCQEQVRMTFGLDHVAASRQPDRRGPCHRHQRMSSAVHPNCATTTVDSGRK